MSSRRIISLIPGGTTVTLTSCYSAYYYMCAASMGAVRAAPTDAPSGIQAGYIPVISMCLMMNRPLLTILNQFFPKCLKRFLCLP